MASFSGLGIGLSFLFGCILLGLIGELYYLLWWKKRITTTDIEEENPGGDGRTVSAATTYFHLFCWKKPSSGNPNRTQDPDGNRHEQDPELGTGKDLLLKGFGGEEGVESELMRLHNLCGPPRFLFTIKEETKEDLESDGGRSRKASRTRSLSDLILVPDTPFLTPLSSPPLKPATHAQPLDSYNNPLFESMSEAEINRLRASPPPKFKFLRDAEEKLMRRLMAEAERKALISFGSVHSTPSKVLPLASSPLTR